MLTYQEERFADVKEEIKPLLQDHWQEIALNKQKIALNPDWQGYRHLDSAGIIRIVTARDGSRLVGYAVFFLSPNLHYQDWPVADGDIFWLHPEYRKGSAGVRLLRAGEEAVKKAGARVITNKTKLHKDLGRLFERLGYAPIERVYSKVLD